MHDDKRKNDSDTNIPEDDFWSSILDETLSEAEDRLGTSKSPQKTKASTDEWDALLDDLLQEVENRADNDVTIPEDSTAISKDDATVSENDIPVYEENSATFPEEDAPQPEEPSPLSVSVRTGPLVIRRGEMLLDTYRVDSDMIGKGGMGAVWKVHHVGWNADLAMKRPKPEAFRTESQKEGFIRECESWINLGLHPNIVSCYYVREIGGIPTIFSEWIEKGDLEGHITDGTLYKGAGREVQERLLDIAIQFARGLRYAHENNLVHQDVKPANLLLTSDWEAKVSDFGIAKARSLLTVLEGEWTEREIDSDMTQASPSGGRTPAYCSPEQAAGQLLTQRTDIYSWAVSVLEMYLGYKPWARGSQLTGPVVGIACWDYFAMSTERPIPTALQELLAKCLEQNPDDRPHDFAQVEAALARIYKSEIGADYPRPEPKAASDTADSLNNRALSFLDLGKTMEAEKCWELALKSNQNNIQSIFNCGLYRWRKGEITDLQLMAELELYTRNTGVPTKEYLDEVRAEQWKASHFAEESGLEYSGGVYQGAPLYQLESRDGRYRIVRDSTFFTLQDLKTGKTVRRFDLKNKYSGFTASYGCALSGDGKTVCYACYESYTYKEQIWTGKEWAELEFDKHGVRLHICDLRRDTEEVLEAPEQLRIRNVVSLAISPDNRKIYIAYDYGYVTVHDREGKLLLVTEVPQNLRCMYLEPESGMLAAGGAQLHLLDREGKLLRSFPGHARLAQSVFLRNDRLIAAANEVIGVWDTESGKCLCSVQWNEEEPGYDAAWLDSENNICAMHGDDLSVFSLAESGETAGYALSRPQTTVSRTSRDERFSTLCTQAEKRIAEGRGIEVLALLEEARQIEGFAGNDRLLALNELAGQQCRRLGVRAVYADPVNPKTVHFPRKYFRACLSGDGESVYLNNGFYDGTVSRFSLPDWELRAKSKAYSNEDLLCGACGLVAVSGKYGSVHLLDAESMQAVQAFNYLDALLGKAPKMEDATQMCAEGKWLAVSRKGGTISVFDLAKHSHLLDLDARLGDRPALDISADGGRLLAADRKTRTLRVWLLPSGEELCSLRMGDAGLKYANGFGRKADANGIDSACFTADEDKVLVCLSFPCVSSGDGKRSRIHNLHEADLKTGKETTVAGPANVERLLPLAGRTGWAALNSETKTVKLFALQDPASVFSFEPVPEDFFDPSTLFLSADADGRYLLYSGTMRDDEGVIKRWKIDWVYG